MVRKFRKGDIITITDNSCAMWKWLDDRGESKSGLVIQEVDYDFIIVADHPHCPHGVFRNSIELAGGPW